MKIKIFKDFIGDGFDTVNLENEINNFIKMCIRDSSNRSRRL